MVSQRTKFRFSPHKKLFPTNKHITLQDTHFLNSGLFFYLENSSQSTDFSPLPGISVRNRVK